MELVVKWLTIALPFLELGYTLVLLLNSRIAAGLLEVIDALKRVIGQAKAEMGTATNPAKGLTEIKIFGENVISLLTALKSSTLSKEDKLIQANRLNDSLYDAKQVTQAKNGKDGEALANFKTKALALRSEIINA